MSLELIEAEAEYTALALRIRKLQISNLKLNTVEDANGCWIWQYAKIPGGYGLTWMNGKKIMTHRCSWELHNGEIPDGLCVCHHCDVPSCVNPAHLFVGTTQDNVNDKMTKGRQARGENSNNKLTEADVIEIRKSNDDYKVLAEKYGVVPRQIWSIKTNRSWTYLE